MGSGSRRPAAAPRARPGAIVAIVLCQTDLDDFLGHSGMAAPIISSKADQMPVARSLYVSDVVTQTALRKLADEYTAQAEEIESKESRPAIEGGSST
jgi:hypothetical protein